MNSEFATITMLRYRDPSGRPTCAADFDKGDVCRFYGTQRLSTHEVCFACGDKSRRVWEGMPRIDGYLRPLKDCPVWGRST